MAGTRSWRRRVPVKHGVDVLVAGGGPAGVAAAVACARLGRSVLLAEWNGALGGLGTLGMVPAFCPMTDGETLLVRGIGQEVVERVRAAGGTGPDDKPEKWDWIPFHPEALKRVYDDMVVETGAILRLNTAVVDIMKFGDKIACAVLTGREGPYAVEASIFIDATGDATLSLAAGADTELGENGETMPPSLCANFAGVDWEKYKKERPNVKKLYKKAIDEGAIETPDPHLVGAKAIGRTLSGLNINHVCGINGADDADLTRGLVTGRKQLPEFLKFYRDYVPGFENAELAASAGLLGVRETRRVIGDYVLNIEDFKARRKFDDDIGLYNYPVDIHPSSLAKEDQEKFEREFHGEFKMGRGESYGIPYRSLIVKGSSNLLVAGRCFSTDRMVQSSARVMPACWLTGQAAGTAAALCAQNALPPRGLDADTLRATLRQAGAYLP